MSNNIQDKIQEGLQEARSACETSGDSSAECAAAWDVVEELQAEAAHQRQDGPKKSSLDKYCDENPDADECRMYED